MKYNFHEAPQYANKSIPQSIKQEIPQSRNEYYTDVEETDETTSMSSPLNSTSIDFDNSIIMKNIYENFHNLSLASQQIIIQCMK